MLMVAASAVDMGLSLRLDGSFDVACCGSDGLGTSLEDKDRSGEDNVNLDASVS
jgi:hypothetical protein